MRVWSSIIVFVLLASAASAQTPAEHVALGEDPRELASLHHQHRPGAAGVHLFGGVEQPAIGTIERVGTERDAQRVRLE